MKGCHKSRSTNQKLTFLPFGNDFLPSSKNIILKGHPIIYLVKYNDICGYNTRCIMSSGLIFYDIIIDILSNKALEYIVEVFHSYFTKTENNKIYMYKGSLKYFY